MKFLLSFLMLILLSCNKHRFENDMGLSKYSIDKYKILNPKVGKEKLLDPSKAILTNLLIDDLQIQNNNRSYFNSGEKSLLKKFNQNNLLDK